MQCRCSLTALETCEPDQLKCQFYAYSLCNFEIRRYFTRGRLCVFRRVTIKLECSVWNRGKTRALYGYSYEIRNLPRVTSRLILKLDRK